jgi:hypothetical protein
VTKREKQAAAAVTLLALIGAALFATDAKADDDVPDDDDDNGDDVPDTPGIFTPTPAIPVTPTPFTPIPAIPGQDPTVIVNRYLGPGEYDNTLYLIKNGDRPEMIARRVLNNVVPQDTTHTLVAPYVGQMAIHSFNLALYSAIWGPDVPNEPSSHSRKGHSGRPSRAVTQRYTAKEYDPEGTMRRWYIGDAFFSRKHEENLTRMRGGKEPLRTTDEYGRKLATGSSYGLIWLPKIVGHRIGTHAAITVEPDLPADLAALAPNIYG